METMLLEDAAQDPPLRRQNERTAKRPRGFGGTTASGFPKALRPGKSLGSFPESAEVFRREMYPSVSKAEWQDWRWQLRNRICDYAGLKRVVALTDSENDILRSKVGVPPFAITPYYASLIHGSAPDHPLRRCVVPLPEECVLSAGESEDPLHEHADSPVPGVVHRYPDRVLLLVTSFCSTYCRYCTRSRLINDADAYAGGVHLDKALAYITSKPEIRDVIVSGGDPLTLPDAVLDSILSRLRAIEHVEMIRIGTKVPAVLPQRITNELTGMLKRHHPLYISIHATHPLELTPEMTQACNRLADAGIPLGSQTVLLQGVNNDADTLRGLFTGLLKLRVRPYYLYQCDPIRGSRHFRTPVEQGVEIIRRLRGYISGYAVPTYVIDAPGGGGKVPLHPDTVITKTDKGYILENYEHKHFLYPESRIPEFRISEQVGKGGEILC